MPERKPQVPAVSSRIGLVFAVLSLIWGSTWIVSGVLADQVPLLLGTAIRFLLSAAFCVPFLLRRRAPLPSRSDLLNLLGLAVIMLVVPLLVLDWARPQLPSATAMVLYALMPLIVILLAPVLGGREAPPRAISVSIAAIAGLGMALSANFTAGQTIPALAVLLAVIASAVASLVAQRLLARCPPLMLTACVCGAAGLLLLLVSRVVERGAPAQWTTQARLTLVLLALVSGASAYVAWFWLLERLPAWQVAAIEWVLPLVGLGESAGYLGVPFSWTMSAGTVITLVSLFLLLRIPEVDDETVSFLGT